MKKLVTESVDIIGRYESYSRDELIKVLDDALLKLDPSERASAQFTVDMFSYEYDSGEYPKLFIRWERLETDKEFDARQKKEEAFAKTRADAEKKEYLRLKKQFEGSKK